MPALQLPPAGQPRTVRDSIIYILSNEWPLSAKKIYNRVRQNGHHVSYQAVHKNLQELITNGILEKESGEYKLDLLWIKQVKEFTNKIENHYTDKSKPVVEQFFTGKETTATFDNLFEFFDFMIDFLARFSQNRNDIYVHFYHLWWSLSFVGEMYIRFKNMVNSYNSATIICRHDTPADRLIFDHYNSFIPNARIKYYVDCAKDCDIFVSGDYIAQIFFTDECRKKIDYAYRIMKETKSDSLNKLLETLFFEKTSITLLVNRNSSLAGQIKKETLKHFETTDKRENSHTDGHKQQLNVDKGTQSVFEKLR
ncbi:MAG: hypothetical protein HYX24_03160 [Candidatus Aenigmarchaeota archaeon]|nr:hypothetical protein [Candidatus Aenigmarchaeota archaeon]